MRHPDPGRFTDIHDDSYAFIRAYAGARTHWHVATDAYYACRERWGARATEYTCTNCGATYTHTYATNART
jgi:hypothetical protein